MKRKIFYAAVLAAFITLGAGQVSAQNTDQQYREKVDRIERKLSFLPSISGFVNFRYQYSDLSGSNNSFDVRRARLDFRGDITDRFDYRIQLEAANSPKVIDAFFRYKVADYFNLQGGQFKIPFSLENPYSPTNLETIDNSLAITKLVNYSDISGLSANGRDIGLDIYGGLFAREGYNIVDYSLGIFNGNGINNTDNNGSKDFAGSLYIHPIKPLTFSVSHYNGSYGPKGDTHTRVRTGAGARYDDGRLLVRGEYIHGKTGTLKSEGYYAVLGYFVHPKWQPVLKFDSFQEDTSDSDSRQNDFLVGLNFWTTKKIRLQVNYTYKNRKWADDYNYLSTQIIAQF